MCQSLGLMLWWFYNKYLAIAQAPVAFNTLCDFKCIPNTYKQIFTSVVVADTCKVNEEKEENIHKFATSLDPPWTIVTCAS